MFCRVSKQRPDIAPSLCLAVYGLPRCGLGVIYGVLITYLMCGPLIGIVAYNPVKLYGICGKISSDFSFWSLVLITVWMPFYSRNCWGSKLTDRH